MPERNYDDAFFQHSNDERASRRSDESTSLGSRPHQYNTRQTARSTAARSRLNATQQQPRNAASYQKPGRYHRPPGPEQPRRRAVGIIASLLVVAAFAVGGYFVVQSLPASITLNGANLEVGGHKTLEDALRASGVKPKPGDFVAVDGSVIEAGKGEPFHATVNGEVATDMDTKLNNGDVVELGDGSAIEEPSETAEESIPYSIEEEGRGPIHVLEGQGADGLKRTKTGSVSGLTTEEVVQEPSNVVRRNVSPQVGEDKVVALTFDDGPWPESTAAVLDVLADQGAKATFFTVGNRIDGEGVDLVKRAAAEGHQICSHSFDHAAGDGQSVNLGYMTPEDQVAEVQKGYEAIEAATGAEASHVFRTPGGNYGEGVMRNVGPLISAEIGWNIDSQDWRKPGAAAIANQVKNAWPGAIVLMHDGGGDRSQTVEALKDALPYLKSQGYRFVTMDELLGYPLS